MTKYILHGGETRIDHEWNDNFFREFFKVDKNPIKILLCYFAREDQKVADLAEEDTRRLDRLSEGKNFKTEVANVEQFASQLKNSDVLFIRGGDTEKLYNRLSQFELTNLLKDKTVAASSAGAYILAKYYFSTSKQQIFEGFGVLPIKVSCHFGKDGQGSAVVEKLQNHKEDLPIICLPETEFKIIEQ
jgi:peptidase E